MSKQITVNLPTNLREVKETIVTSSHRVLVFLLILGSFFGGYFYRMRSVETTIENVTRQLQGRLTQQEIALQAKDETINKLQSTITDSNKLMKETLAQQDANNKKQIEALIKQYDLRIDSLTTAMATLQGKDNAGTASSGVIDGVRWYDWRDSYGRFHLHSPDIMKPYAEFTYDQRFKLDVVVFKQQQSDGALRAQTVHLYEIDGNGNVINEAKVDLDKSKFKYVIDNTSYVAPTRKWLATMTTQGEIGATYLPYHRYQGMLGIGATAAAGNSNQFVGITVMGFPPTIAKSAFGIGASIGYSPHDRGHVAYRLQLSWSFLDLFK